MEQCSFSWLVGRLAAVHEEQEELIRRLNEENDSLRKRVDRECDAERKSLGSADFAGDSHNGLGKCVDFHKLSNVSICQPTLPESDMLDDDMGEATYYDAEDNAWIDAEKMPEENTAGEEVAWSDSDNNTLADGRAAEAPANVERPEGEKPTLQRGACQPLQWLMPALWPEWVPYARSDPSIRIMKSNIMRLCVVDDATGQAMTVVDSCYACLVVKPNSVKRLLWDFLSSLMVCYDVVTIPLIAISLDRDEILGGGTGWFTEIMDWVTIIFWTIDCPCSFLTGYHCEGLLEMRPTEVARHYLKTWFPFDFFILFIDWSIVYAQLTAGGAAHFLGLFRAGKTARMARILRTVRVLRFMKLQRVIGEALEMIKSESIRALFNVALATMFIVASNHYLACGWFLIGHIGRLEEMPNWIEENKIQDGTEAYAYFTSFHWSLTQFTPASMEIRPYNLPERVYSIICLMFALIAFSSFLGSITASITQLRKCTTEAGRQQSILRQYFLRNHVSSGLSKSIWKFLQTNHYNHQTRTHTGSIAILKLLPPHLHGKLHQELYGPYITRTPFFYHYMAFNCEGLKEVCSKTITEASFTCGEDLFLEGKVAKSMIVVISGYLDYKHGTREDLSHNIGKGSWIAEAVLWVKWVHTGTLSAHTSAEVIAVDSAKFREVMNIYQNSIAFVQVYANAFLDHLHCCDPDDMTDLMNDLMNLEDMVRQAWFEVSRSEQDRELFQEMPVPERRRTSWGRRFSVKSARGQSHLGWGGLSRRWARRLCNRLLGRRSSHMRFSQRCSRCSQLGFADTR